MKQEHQNAVYSIAKNFIAKYQEEKKKKKGQPIDGEDFIHLFSPYYQTVKTLTDGKVSEGHFKSIIYRMFRGRI